MCLLKELNCANIFPKKNLLTFVNQATLTIEGPSTPCTPCTYSAPVLFLINTNKNRVHFMCSLCALKNVNYYSINYSIAFVTYVTQAIIKPIKGREINKEKSLINCDSRKSRSARTFKGGIQARHGPIGYPLNPV